MTIEGIIRKWYQIFKSYIDLIDNQAQATALPTTSEDEEEPEPPVPKRPQRKCRRTKPYQK